MKAEKPVFTYHYRGLVERGTGDRRGYARYDGFSEDGSIGKPLYPWMTVRECFEDAKARGGRAKFVREC